MSTSQALYGMLRPFSSVVVRSGPHNRNHEAITRHPWLRRLACSVSWLVVLLIEVLWAGCATAQPAYIQQKRVDNAQACFVHLHGNEPSAIQVMRESLQKQNFAANAVWLTAKKDQPDGPLSGARYVTIGRCQINPNRVFTDTGLSAEKGSCGDAAAVDAWVRQLRQAVSACTQGDTLPTIAFHNNASFKNDQFKRKKGDTSEMEDEDMLGLDPPNSQGNFILITDTRDFQNIYDRMVGGTTPQSWFKAVLLREPTLDKGSLSFAQRKKRYVNLEFRTNEPESGRKMAQLVFDALNFTSDYE